MDKLKTIVSLYEIGDTVYLLNEISKSDDVKYGLYQSIKCVVCGYYNFDGIWKIKLRHEQDVAEIDYDINVKDAINLIFSRELIPP